jgi:hypothetical protein
VLIDPGVLDTLPDHEYPRACSVIKCGVIPAAAVPFAGQQQATLLAKRADVVDTDRGIGAY